MSNQQLNTKANPVTRIEIICQPEIENVEKNYTKKQERRLKKERKTDAIFLCKWLRGIPVMLQYILY